jgi:hypothetical protein
MAVAVVVAINRAASSAEVDVTVVAMAATVKAVATRSKRSSRFADAPQW